MHCVQKFDASLELHITWTFRISLRSSSIRDPRDPLLGVVNETNAYNPKLIIQGEALASKIKKKIHVSLITQYDLSTTSIPIPIGNKYLSCACPDHLALAQSFQIY